MAVEADEQWSFVRKKQQQRWLWVVFGHHTHEVMAYCFGPRTDAVAKSLLKRLTPLNAVKWFTDGLPAYQRLLQQEQHHIGKCNTQSIERFFLTFANAYQTTE